MNPITALLQAMGYGFDAGTPIGQAMVGTQDGRLGMTDPRIVNPDAPRPAVAPARPVAAPAGAGRGVLNPEAAANGLSPLPVTEIPPQPGVAQVTVGEAPSYANPILSQMARMPDPKAAVPEQPGFLSKFFNNTDEAGNSAFMYLMRGLGAAGSADPVKAMQQYAAQDAENQKTRLARIKANQPKIDQITGTPFFQITYPDGRTEVSSNPALAAYFKQQSESKAAQKLTDMRTQAELNAQAAGAKAADKLATETLPEVTQARTNIAELRGIASEIGSVNADGSFTKKTDNVSGPVAGTAASVPIIGPSLNPVGADIRNRAEKVIQGGLRAVLGGQFTQAEGDRFIARAYDKNADEATNFKNLQRAADELEVMASNKEAAVKWFQERKTMAGFTEALAAGKVGASAPAAAPQAAGGMARPTSAAEHAALPPGTRYVAPDGKVYTKK